MSEPIIQTTNLESTLRAIRSRNPQYLEKQVVPYHADYKTIPNQNFAPTTSVRTASASGSGGMIYGQPQFFSPVHTPINWQIPSRRIEQYSWARFFYSNEAKVAASIDFYSQFPVSGYQNECKDRKVKKYFDKLQSRLNLEKWIKLMSHEIHLLGDCFPFLEISCPICNGSGRNGDELCDHEGGSIRRVVILNPDYIEVFTSPLNPEPIIALKPDEELINMVQRKTPGYEYLTPQVISLVSSGKPIRLDNRNVTHLKYGEGGYGKYGTGMVRRLFPILSYKTKLMVAQWIVAERLIVPIRVVKVGNDERPAGPADIAMVQEQLAASSQDPNLTIVTHNAFEIEWVGSSGHVLALSNEFELINQEILDGMMINNALLNGEGPTFCVSDDTRLLTNNGLKYRAEFDIEKDLVATFNKENGMLEYQKAIKKYEYDYNSIDGDDLPLKRFLTNRIDMMVTPNHKILCSDRKLTTGPRGQKIDGQIEGCGEWKVIRADRVKNRAKFRSCVDGWDGKEPEKEEYFGIKTEDFLRIVGWYVSEGWRNVDKKRNNSIYSVGISQSSTANPETFKKIKDVLKKYNICRLYPSGPNSFIISNTMNKELVTYLKTNLGVGSSTKRIPKELKNLSSRYLKILLEALVDGDGSERPATKKKQTDKKYYGYYTVSTQLRDDVIEILFKLGFSPRFSTARFDSPNLQTIYAISWSGDSKLGKFPTLASRKWNGDGKTQSTNRVIFDEDYVGKVWCVEVPNHFIITERNGLFGIHGNSAAAVGIEAMIERLESFRGDIARWIEEKIYLPEAIRQGFIERDEETGEENYIYPKVKWNAMHLRDQQQYRQFVLSLYEKGLLSAQTVLEAFDFDPDQEIERKRYDALQMLANGNQQGGGGMGGGFGGGGGGGGLDLGALGGGGAPDMGGGAPDMGGGGDGGGAPISAPTGGEAPPAVASSNQRIVTADIADPSKYGGKILKEKNREKLDREIEKTYKDREKHPEKGAETRDEKGRIIFTRIERELIPHLEQYQQNGLIRYPIVPQFRVQYGNREYPIDFAIPHLKIGIEADGEIFHSSPKQLQSDKERDRKLSQLGWTILRFTDSEIDKKIERIMSTILKTIMQKETLIKSQAEKTPKT